MLAKFAPDGTLLIQCSATDPAYAQLVESIEVEPGVALVDLLEAAVPDLFTGELIDKIGRHTHFVRGKRIVWEKKLVKQRNGKVEEETREKVVPITLNGDKVTLVSHDPKTGKIKARTAGGVNVVADVDEFDFGHGAAPAPVPAPAPKPALAPTPKPAEPESVDKSDYPITADPGGGPGVYLNFPEGGKAWYPSREKAEKIRARHIRETGTGDPSLPGSKHGDGGNRTAKAEPEPEPESEPKAAAKDFRHDPLFAIGDAARQITNLFGERGAAIARRIEEAKTLSEKVTRLANVDTAFLDDVYNTGSIDHNEYLRSLEHHIKALAVAERDPSPDKEKERIAGSIDKTIERTRILADQLAKAGHDDLAYFYRDVAIDVMEKIRDHAAPKAEPEPAADSVKVALLDALEKTSWRGSATARKAIVDNDTQGMRAALEDAMSQTSWQGITKARAALAEPEPEEEADDDTESPVRPIAGEEPEYPDPLDLTPANVTDVWAKMRDEITANDAKLSPNQAGQLAAARILNGVKKAAGDFIDQMDEKVRNREKITDEEDAKYIAAGESRNSLYTTLVKVSGYRPYPDDDENPLANRPFGAPKLANNVAKQEATNKENEIKAAEVAASIAKTKQEKLAKSQAFDQSERAKDTENKRQQKVAEWMHKNGFAPWRGDTEESRARKKEDVVKAAIADGKTVPPEVLADYPDLAPKPVEQPPEPKKVTDDKLATESGGAADVVRPREPVGADAEAAPDALLPATDSGAGQGPGGVPGSDDGSGAGAVDAPDLGEGDGSGDSGRDRPGPTLAENGLGAVSDEAAAAAAASVAEAPTAENPTDVAGSNFHYTGRAFTKGGLKAKFAANLEAIRTYKAIGIEGRTVATPAEQEVMSQYIGWGQFSALFNEYGRNPTAEKWDKEREQLKAAISGDEWRAASASINNAHYTDPSVVDAHWKMAERLGFKGGTFLETSAGIGYYLGMMPSALKDKTHTSAVELDSLTGGMLAMLYPKDHVEAATGFENYQAPDNFYDLIASNVPFGKDKPYDEKYNQHDAMIHDYFFLKSADLVRPGGLVMHITSTGTMDKGEGKNIRAELAKTCDLVSAIRFPTGAHREGAGTDVVTDMIILRKRGKDEQPVDPKVTLPEAMPAERSDPLTGKPDKTLFTGTTTDSLGRLYHWVDGVRVPGPNWMDVGMAKDPAGGEDIPVNQYFIDHPEQVLGTLDRSGQLYGGDLMGVSMPGMDKINEIKERMKAEGRSWRNQAEDSELATAQAESQAFYEEKLAEAIERLPEGMLKPPVKPKAAFVPETAPAPGDVKDGAFAIKDGKVFVRKAGALVELEKQPSKNNLARLEGMMGLRDARRKIVRAQTVDHIDAGPARAELNTLYDDFVAKYGFLHTKENQGVYKGDPDLQPVLALEKWHAKTGVATKTAIFERDTVRTEIPVEHAGSTAEALTVSLHQTGALDIDLMVQLTGKPLADIEKDLTTAGIAFLEPGGAWKPADQYLSGNVRQKLVAARAAALADPRYKPNQDALEKVQPEDKYHEDIGVKLGSAWIPPTDVQGFMGELLQGNKDDWKITYNPISAAWQADWTSSGARQTSNMKIATEQWATDGASIRDLLNAALNSKTLVIKGGVDENGQIAADADGKPLANKKLSDDAAAKIQDMKDAFKEWLWKDDKRRIRLSRYYNDTFNNIRPISYNGSHQTFPGMDPNFHMRKHQSDFVWQVITTGRGLAAHEVGSGKAQPLDAKILTPGGWVRMGDIRVGDEVIAGDGTRTIVEAVFPQGEKDIFRVTFSDGAATECCNEHLWLTQTYHERNYAIAGRHAKKTNWLCDKPKVRTLAEIRETLVDPRLGGVKNHSIPVVGAVEFFASPVPISPYVLGVLLGDGHISKSGVRITSAKTDIEIIESIRAELSEDLEIRENSCAATRCVVSSKGVAARTLCSTWAIVRAKLVGFGKNKEPNPIMTSLRELDLDGHRSWEKFIPDIYKFNETSVRLAVLQGLLDTDGTVSKTGMSVVYYSVSNRLADDVEFLVRSLGGVVGRSVKHPTYIYKGEKKNGRLCHVLSIRLPSDVMPFRLNRKSELVVPKTKYLPARYIVSVEPVGKKEAQCIRVSHPSHLYVTDDFIVTHNTASMIAAAMELRRLGLAKKPCIACLKSNMEALTADAIKLYPGAKILTTAGVTTAAQRNKVISQIATGDYDLIIMTHDNLGMLQMLPETVSKYINSEKAELLAAMQESARDDPSKGNKVVKSMETALKNLDARLKAATSAKRKDNAVYFEECGIDMLFVDESHNFKALKVITKQQRIKGIPTSESQKAANMLMRTRWLMENHGGRGVAFATGTPVTNTMAEMYNVQRYLQPNELKERGVDRFDAWASVFGEIVTKPEFTMAGEYKPATRFASFSNLLELSGIAAQVMDVQRTEDLKNLDGTPAVVRPDRHDIMVKATNSPAIQDLMAQLKVRAKSLHNGKAQKGDDNMLVICTDGRKGALDMRMLDPNAPDDPTSKLNLCVENVLRIHNSDLGYVAGDHDRGGLTQIIFSDLGVNPVHKSERYKGKPADEIETLGADGMTLTVSSIDNEDDDDDNHKAQGGQADVNMGSATGFSVYDDIIGKLVAGGIPRDRIADFSQLEGKKKEEAMQDMNDGRILVAIGSTQKLGTGVNVQRHITAMHNLDVPWLPASIEQRDGRGWRQGNENSDVDVYRYIAEGSLDQKFWDIIAKKTAFIRQVISGKDRVTDHYTDDDSEELTAEQLSAAASGDPRIMELVDVMDELATLKSAQSRHARQETKWKDAAARSEAVANQQDARLVELKAIQAHLAAHPGDVFALDVGGIQFDKRPEAGDTLKAKIDQTDTKYGEEVIGTYRGMDLIKGRTSYRQPAGELRLQVPETGESVIVGYGLGSVENTARKFADKTIEDRTIDELERGAGGRTISSPAAGVFMYDAFTLGARDKDGKPIYKDGKRVYETDPAKPVPADLIAAANTTATAAASKATASNRITQGEAEIARTRKGAEDLRALLGKPFAKQAELDVKLAKKLELEAGIKASHNEAEGDEHTKKVAEHLSTTLKRAVYASPAKDGTPGYIFADGSPVPVEHISAAAGAILNPAAPATASDTTVAPAPKRHYPGSTDVGPFTVHKTENGKGWQITHGNTGLGALRADKKTTAVLAAKIMGTYGDWSFTDAKDFGGDARDKSRAVIRAVREDDTTELERLAKDAGVDV